MCLIGRGKLHLSLTETLSMRCLLTASALIVIGQLAQAADFDCKAAFSYCSLATPDGIMSAVGCSESEARKRFKESKGYDAPATACKTVKFDPNQRWTCTLHTPDGTYTGHGNELQARQEACKTIIEYDEACDNPNSRCKPDIIVQVREEAASSEKHPNETKTTLRPEETEAKSNPTTSTGTAVNED